MITHTKEQSFSSRESDMTIACGAVNEYVVHFYRLNTGGKLINLVTARGTGRVPMLRTLLLKILLILLLLLLYLINLRIRPSCRICPTDSASCHQSSP